MPPAGEDALNIGQVIKLYKEHGHQYYGSALHKAMLQYADTEVNEPLNNDSYADALFLTDIMLQKTNRSLCVLTGNCVGQFLSVLNDSLIGALKRIKNLKGKARFILVDTDGKVPEFLKTLKAAGYPISVTFAKAVNNAKVSHYIIADGKMLRDEKYHEELTDESAASDIRASVYLNSPVHAQSKQVRFDSVWEQLNPTESKD